MEPFDKYYTKFERPPLAPIYTPTAEEFADPIAYVEKIRHEAERYGVVKIIPPANFKPPFAIDMNSFEFTPRIQQLNEIDAIVRERKIFDERLNEFWELKCQPLRAQLIEGKPVNLYRLYSLVREFGGNEAVESKKQWPSINKKMNHRNSAKLRSIYVSVLLPFVSVFEEINENEPEDNKFCKDSTNAPQSMQGGQRRPPGRMMAGLATRNSPRKAPRKRQDNVAHVFCSVCNRGDAEDRLLLCDCDASCHTFCCTPKLTEVPAGDWKCPKCVAEAVAKLGSQNGFYDAEEKFTISSFKDYADHFKKNYFNIGTTDDVGSEVVEKEFWRILFDQQKNVQVKYGADLITSKVGSGFPRKTDDNRGADARLKQHYASHAWNLNNLPVLKESVLSHIETGISGMMVPWVYVGMCFSTFCWHTEDHWTYSINYNHLGEKKIWYGVGGQDAEKFEDAVRELAPELTNHQKDIFHHMTTAVNPALLRAKGVDVYTVQQKAGEFVITFPRAYHAGYNEGFNLAEAVNFAPIDWLKMGRLCIAEYGNVRRFCVFSHDELVMKMVNSCDKLGIAMSLASLDEMRITAQRESSGRSLLRRRGVKRFLFEDFGKLPDDSRSCRKCNTTMFHSALTCSHNHTVCLDHIGDICDKCPYSECTLKYHFTNEELGAHVKKLEERTTHYSEWAKRAESALDEKKDRPTLVQVDHLIDEARKKHFPVTNLLQNLLTIQRKCHGLIEKANQVINGKIRTRKETRIQRADTRMDMGGVRELLAEIGLLPCEVTKIRDRLEDVLVKLEQWCDSVDEAVDQNRPVEELLQLKSEGEKFEIKTSQMDLLLMHINRSEWQLKVAKIVNFAPVDGMEKDEDFLTRERWCLDSAQRWIREAGDLGMSMEEQNALHEKVKTAMRMNNAAERLINGRPTVKQIEDLWKQVRFYDWCHSKGIDSLRAEIVQASHFNYQDALADCSLKKLGKVLDKSKKSTVLSSTDAFVKMLEVQAALLRFTHTMISQFKPNSSYYSLGEIISNRDDLAALIEGQSVPRYLEELKDYPMDDWDPLYDFGSMAELKDHLALLEGQQTTFLKTLQQVNLTRPLKDTCACGAENPSSKDTVRCILCNCQYHVECCEWNSFFGNLPLGCFLCPRCLRGKRPCIEDVQAAVARAPKNAMEVILTRHLTDKVRTLTKEAMDLWKKMPSGGGHLPAELFPKAQHLIEGVLGSEVIDLSVFNRVMTLIPLVYGDYLATQAGIMKKVRDSPVRGVPLRQLFAAGKKSRKRSSGCKEGRREKKRHRKVEEDVCSAPECLRPYGEQVNWIQCEVDDCQRWYHYLCVGETVERAQTIQCYECYRCKGRK